MERLGHPAYIQPAAAGSGLGAKTGPCEGLIQQALATEL